MTQPLNWTWVAQTIIIIVTVAGSVASIVALVLHRRPLHIEVITREINKTWEEVRSEIEQRSPGKIEWVYTDDTKKRLKESGVKQDG